MIWFRLWALLYLLKAPTDPPTTYYPRAPVERAYAEHILATEDLFRHFFRHSDDVDYQLAINKYEHIMQNLSLTIYIRDYRVQGVATEHMSQDMTHVYDSALAAQTTDMGAGPSTYADLGPSSFPKSTQSQDWVSLRDS